MWLGVAGGFETFFVMTIAIAVEVEVFSTFGLGVAIEMVELAVGPGKSHV